MQYSRCFLFVTMQNIVNMYIVKHSFGHTFSSHDGLFGMFMPSRPMILCTKALMASEACQRSADTQVYGKRLLLQHPPVSQTDKGSLDKNHSRTRLHIFQAVCVTKEMLPLWKGCFGKFVLVRDYLLQEPFLCKSWLLNLLKLKKMICTLY